MTPFAFTNRYAQGLVGEYLANPDLVWAAVPKECDELIASFSAEE